MRQNCPVFAIERGYRAAVREEDYAAAASFRDQGAGLVGWWCGRGETEDEPGGQYGVMMQITPEHGRYVAPVGCPVVPVAVTGAGGHVPLRRTELDH